MEIDVFSVDTNEASTIESSKDEPNKKKNSILDCVAKSNGFFKSQQRGEKDLNFDEKWKIAKDILETNIPLFLSRYSRFIHYEDISYFEPYRTDYEVNFHLTEIEKVHSQSKGFVYMKTKNRRYEALQRLIKQGSYFSDSEMRKRSPILYEQMIGRFLTESEKKAVDQENKEEMKFSTLLMEHMDRNEICSLRREQQKLDDAVWEEEIESESDDELDDEPPCEDERQLFRNEFLSAMYEQFLSGKDKDFDYSNVDDNAEYDNFQLCDLDEEEKYFDSEEPEYLD